MKIIFLDIDGVLNNAEFFRNNVPPPGRDPDDQLDPAGVRRLNIICARTGAVVVISSTWRILYKNAAMRGILGNAGFTGKLVGVTGENVGTRGDQIAKWLANYQRHPIESFVILDDNSDMGALKHRLVQTLYEDGLQDVHVERAVEMLHEC